MTIKDLYKYTNIKKEIVNIENNIKLLEETIISSSKISGMPLTTDRNSSPTETLGVKLAYLKSKLTDKTEKLIDEANKIEKFIDTIEDADIRIIIRKRFLGFETWQQIGDEMFTDRSTPYYRLKKYLENREKDNVND